LLWARQAGVLSRILPESEKWGIDSIHALVRAEQDLGWTPDGLLRLAAIVPPDAERMQGLADRLKLSSADRQRLVKWATATTPKPDATEGQLGKEIFRGDRQAIVDRLRLALAGARAKAVEDNGALVQAGGYSQLLGHAEQWKAPAFPLKGADLLIAGAQAGPAVGKLFRTLRDEWVDAGFAMDRSALLERAAILLKS